MRPFAGTLGSLWLSRPRRRWSTYATPATVDALCLRRRTIAFFFADESEHARYLHEGAGKQVVHRHFRPEHVLVDGELRVSVSGCGLAPLVAEVICTLIPMATVRDSRVSCVQFRTYTRACLSARFQRSDCCGVATSYDYEPPEAGGGAAWTPKGDVYSFGVVMLQLLTGRRPYDGARARGERRLVPWASARLYDLAALRKMADPRLVAPPPVRSLSRFADVISRCIQVSRFIHRRSTSTTMRAAGRSMSLIRLFCLVVVVLGSKRQSVRDHKR